MLVMAINPSIGYICTYIPIDLSINRLVRTTTTLYSYIEFFLPLLLCVYIILICLATIGIHTSIYVCMHTVNVANQERIPSIMEFPCNVYRVSLCVHSVCVLFFPVGSFNLPMFWRYIRNVGAVFIYKFTFLQCSAYNTTSSLHMKSKNKHLSGGMKKKLSPRL